MKEENYPKVIRKNINYCMLATGIVLILAFMNIIGGIIDDNLSERLDLLTVIYLVIVASLTWGTYKKSRVSALVLFFLYVCSLCLSIYSLGSGDIGVLLMGLAMCALYFCGVVGTFQHHRYVRNLAD